MAKANTSSSQKNTVATEDTENKSAEAVTTQNTGTHGNKDESQKAVCFIVPWKRYSRGDVAVFPSERATELVERGAAQWLDSKAKKTNAGDDDNHETDIG